jgi:NAD(P)-dependent dehydrogenase (short-subunit alcohol dehydrogenase family)
MSTRLTGRVAVVVGAGSSAEGFGPGNGEAAALAYARDGARIAAVDMNAAAAGRTAQQVMAEGGSALAIAADASSAEAVAAMIAQVLAAYGRIDILHNNVGIEQLGGPVETPEEAWDRVHAVNLKSVFLACKHAIPVMERQGGGVITNISSIASVRWTGISYLAYSSSKAALNQVTRTIARQYAARRIRCNAILPGYLDTPHIRTLYAHLDAEAFAATQRERDAQCPMGHQGSAWDVAHAAVFLASDEARYITGNLLVVDGGVSL